MSDLDRFTAFLPRAAANYNEPPEVPAEAIWRGVEEGVGDNAASSRSPTGGLGDAGAPAGAAPADDAPIIAPGYRAPPPPPRDEMWDRIEASWARRQAAASASDGPRAAPRRRPAWVGRRGTAGWAAALAAAASLVLGIALGRGTRTAPPGGATTAAPPAVAATAETVAPRATVAEHEPRQPDASSSSAIDVAGAELAAVIEAAETRERGEAANRNVGPVDAPELAPVRGNRFEPEHDYVTARHLERAAILLTAFRTDRRTPASEQDLAQWARELLLDTRMFLGLSDFSSPIEQALLEDLELVLIQIAGLGPGAPDFEWALARESMERRATLTRLRAVSAEAET